MLNPSAPPYGRAWKLAWPLILANLSAPLMGLADTAMLGHQASPLYLAAVAIGANLLTFALWIFGFLRMGTTSLTGRALGANKLTEVYHTLQRGLGLGAALGLGLILLQFGLLAQILVWMTPDPALREMAQSYCSIRLSAAPAVLMNYAALGWLIGLQRSRAALVIMLFINLCNLGLDWLFIMVLGWGSDGAALASALAEYAGFCLTLVLLRHNLRRLSPPREPLSTAWRDWLPLLRINRDLFIRTAALLFVFTFFTAQAAHQGPLVLAANAILLQLLLLVSHLLDGYAHAAEAMVAKAVGGRDTKSFAAACWATGAASIALAAGLTLALALSKWPLLQLITDIAPLRQIAAEHWWWLVALPLVSVVSYWLDGIFIGAGATAVLRNRMLAAVLLVFLPAWWLSQSWGNHGLWLSLALFNLARGLALASAVPTLAARLRA